MKFPEIPKYKKITLEQALLELMDSITEEETAISKLLHAEAKKTIAFTGEKKKFPTSPGDEEIIKYCHSLNNIADSILMKEWLLLKKLETILQISEGLDKNKISQSTEKEVILREPYLIHFKNSIKNFYNALTLVQQAIQYLSKTLESLLKAIHLLKDEETQKKCKFILSMTINELFEIQRLLAQKENVLKSQSKAHPFYTAHTTYLPNYSIQPISLNTIHSTSKSSNMVHYHLQSGHKYPSLSTIKSSYEFPLKPWLSQKVYRGSYINKSSINKGSTQEE